MAICFCGGEEPPNRDPIPVAEVISQLDALLDRNDTAGARELLVHWKNAAAEAGDRAGELAMQNELIGFYRKAGERDAAYACLARAEALVEELGIAGEVSAATVFLNMGTARCAFGDFRAALSDYERALAVYRRRLPPDDPLLAGLYNNMATALEEVHEFARARQSYELALAIVARPGGELDAAVTCVNLAHLAERTTGDEAEIAALLERAKRYLDTPELPRNGNYAFVCSKCAPSFGHFGFFWDRQELEARVKEIYERP